MENGQTLNQLLEKATSMMNKSGEVGKTNLAVLTDLSGKVAACGSRDLEVVLAAWLVNTEVLIDSMDSDVVHELLHQVIDHVDGTGEAPKLSPKKGEA